ncbi:GNVR domain-containing protein [Massilia aerilata]|uniref:GNVR domain-containing protein n=1 Tax=Massilia aerilata TaxID=453817 RepID=A0ABW0S0Y3_9BURK
MTSNDSTLHARLRNQARMDEHAAGTAPEFALDGSGDELKTYFRVLLDSRWLIIAVALLVTLAGSLYAASRDAVYEANLVVRVEEPSPNATKNVLSDVASLFETKKTTMGEMEVLRSRKVILPAVRKLHLDIIAEPKRFPLPGLVQMLSRGGLPEPGLFGRGGYTWGDERIEVQTFSVPPALLNHRFVITAMDGRQYRVEDGVSGAWTGTVGRTMTVNSPLGAIDLAISRLDGRPGAQFFLVRIPEQTVVNAIQKALGVNEMGKQSGIIEVTLQGDDPVQVSAALNQIAQEYTRQNLAHDTEQAQKSLAILEQRLPLLKRELQASESAYNAFRHQKGTVNLGEEAKLKLQQSAAAAAKRFELLQKRGELQTHLSDQHPAMLALNEQLSAVERELDTSGGAIRALPGLEQQELNLTRDIKVNTDLYAQLSNTAQQLRILAASKLSNVQLIDAAAVPDVPVKPNRPMIVGIASLLGLLLGTAAAFVRRAWRDGVDSAQRIEHSLHAKVVLADIPHSSQQKRLSRQAGLRSDALPLLASVAPGDPAIEALRSFRAALQFAMPHLRNNIVMITGPTAHLGKSFVAANAAAVVAASGKKVLLVDMDLRNGHLHRYFGESHNEGLFEAIAAGDEPGRGIRRQVLENLDFIPTGTGAAGRHEFLMQRDLDLWLRSVSVHYDLVLIDAPPVLAVADPAIIGAHAGAVFLVARAGVSTEEEIAASVSRLNQAGISPEGIIFNDSKLRRQIPDYSYSVAPARIGWTGRTSG